MEEMERLRARLDIIRAVEPILSALRTISLATRMSALRSAENAQRYEHELARIVALIGTSARAHSPLLRQHRSVHRKVQLLVIGSERGLCGAFNEALVTYAEQVQRELTADGAEVRLWVLGARLERAFRNKGIEPVWTGHLSLTAVPSFNLAEGLVSRGLHACRNRHIDSVEVVYNAYRGLAPFQTSQIRLLPAEIPAHAADDPALSSIVETDPRQLLRHALQLWLSSRLQGALLDSAAAEHTARFQLMDGAAENAGRLIDELELYLQAARQEAITSEMQDLASGAGLLRPQYA
jgi:F-type H+-transporting ATPase subunit gamma